MTTDLQTPVEILKDKLTGRNLEVFELTVQLIQDYNLKRHRDAAQEATKEAEDSIAELEAAIEGLSNLPKAAQAAAQAGIEVEIAQHQSTVDNALRSVIEQELAEGPYKAWVDAAKSGSSGRGRSSGSSYWSRYKDTVAYFGQGKTDDARKKFLQDNKMNPSSSLIMVKGETFTDEEWAKVDGAKEYSHPHSVHVIAHDGNTYKYVGTLGTQNSPNSSVKAMRALIGLDNSVSVGIHGTGWDTKYRDEVGLPNIEEMKTALVK